MEHRPQSLAAFLILCLAAHFGAARAADADAAPLQDMATAQSMQAEAESLRNAADARLDEETAACARKFLENDCRNAAKKRHLESLRESRRLAARGREMEYQARLRERDSKRQERAAKAEARKQESEESESSPRCPTQESCDNEPVAP
jgi:hypothetical protein